MPMLDSFEEVFTRRLQEKGESIKTRLATGSINGVEEIYELRGRALMLDWVLQEFVEVIQGYQDED
jgi:hypothetical protein